MTWKSVKKQINISENKNLSQTAISSEQCHTEKQQFIGYIYCHFCIISHKSIEKTQNFGDRP